MAAPVPSGDDEIDAARRAAAERPTDEGTYADRLVLLSAWIYLLQRCGVELSGCIEALDGLQTAADRGDAPAAFAALDGLYARLEGLQPTAAQLPREPAARPAREVETPAEPAPARHWGVYGGNVHHTASTAEAGPSQGQIAWRFPLGLAWYARPAVDGGRVYAASPGMRTMLYCLDLDTGRVIFKTRRPRPDATRRLKLGRGNVLAQSYATPAVACTPLLTPDAVILAELGAQGLDEGLRHLTWVDRSTGDVLRRRPAGYADYRMGWARLAGEGEFLVYSDGVQRITARPPQAIGHDHVVCRRADSGDVEWSFRIGLHLAEPVVCGERAYVGTADGMLFSLNLTGASAREGFGLSDRRRVAWHFRAGGATNAPAALDARCVFLGANDGCAYCIDRDTGRLRWKVRTAETEDRAMQLFSRPTLCAGRLYVGTATRRLLCLDAGSGEVRWAEEMPDWVRSAPAAAGGRIWAACMDGTVCCFSDRGQRLWTARVGAHPIYADLVLAGGKLLVGSSDLSLWCLDAAEGTVLWRRRLLEHADVAGRLIRSDELGSGGWYQSKPTGAEGKVFIGSPSRFVFGLDCRTGRELWRCELSGAVSGSPAWADGRIFVGQQGGGEEFCCLDAATGRPLWKQSLGWVWSSANVAEGKLFVPGVDGYLSCLSAADGRVRWRYRTGAAAHPEPPVEAGRVFFGSWDHYVYAFEAATGRLLWQFHTGGSPDSGAPIAFGGRLYVPMGGKRLCCLDAATGRCCWEYAVAEGCMNASPALDGERLFISTSVRGGAIPPASRIRCLDARDGRQMWEHPGGGITAPAVAAGKVYFACTSDPFFRCVDATGSGDGTTRCLWRCALGDRVYESVPAIYAGKAYILSEDGYLYAFE